MYKTRRRAAGAKPQRMTPWHVSLIAFTFASSLLLGSCSETEVRPSRTTPAATRTEQPREQIVPKTPTKHLTQVSSTATEAIGVTEPPLATAPRIWAHSWSPDGEMLAFWTWTPEELEFDYTFPPGSLHFLDVRNSVSCDSPVEVAYPYFSSTFAWSREGMAWGLAPDGRVFGFFPCQVEGELIQVNIPERILSVFSLPAERMVVMDEEGVELNASAVGEHAILLRGESTVFLYDAENQQSRPLDGRLIGGTYSPDAMAFATTVGVEGDPDALETQIRDLGTGLVRAQVVWNQRPAKGISEPAGWLNAKQLLIASDVIGGPLILTVEGLVIEVAPDLFLRNCDFVCPAIATPSDSTTGFHIAMADSGVSGPQTWLLYHSEDAKVDSLPALDLLSFSPDGQLLSGISPGEREQEYQLWLRKTDPVEAAPSLIPLNLIYVPLAWSPNSSTLAYALTNRVGSLNVQSMGTLEWSLGSYLPISMLWSTDSRRLAVQASSQQTVSSAQEALFVLDLP